MLPQMVNAYYKHRGLKWPNTEEALMWAMTEIGEVCELILAQKGGWSRNNPEKDKYLSEDEYANRLEEELGDVIMMLQVAGQNVGLNPIGGLTEKMCNTLFIKGVERGKEING